jgi:hypothetical protein
VTETGTEIVASNSQGLSQQQEAFVAALMRGVEAEDAALEVGRPGDATAFLLDPAVQGAIEARGRAMLISSIPTVLVEIRTLAKKATSTDRARIEACRAILAMVGFVPPMRERAKTRQASLADMQTEDLRAFVDQLTGELAARATPVDAPKAKPSPDKEADYLA